MDFEGFFGGFFGRGCVERKGRSETLRPEYPGSCHEKQTQQTTVTLKGASPNESVGGVHKCWQVGFTRLPPRWAGFRYAQSDL